MFIKKIVKQMWENVNLFIHTIEVNEEAPREVYTSKYLKLCHFAYHHRLPIVIRYNKNLSYVINVL